MSNPKHEVDRILRDSLADGSMSGAESQVVWNRIDAELAGTEPQAARQPKRPSRAREHRLRLAVVAVTAIALVTVIALAPWNSSDEGGKASFTSLSNASASEVLNVTADSAIDQPSLVPGPGEELYFRLLQTTYPGSSEGNGTSPQEAVIEEWIGADGRGVRLDEVHSSSSASSEGDIETSPDRIEFDASSIERSLMASDSWRALFTLEQLYAMPTEPKQALAFIRKAIRSSIVEGGVVGRDEADIVGFDFLAFQSVASLLMQAPLSGDQRSGLFELLADTPEWYSQKGTAGVAVSNRGLSESRDGQEGILIEADMRLSEMEAAILAGGERSPRFGVLLDPETGSVLETRVVFGEGQSPMLRITSEALETVPKK